jgi:glyoxylase-like metal-dependent hydrolase (beta-lactamase superfamily II)
MKHLVVFALLGMLPLYTAAGPAASPYYSIEAIHYADSPGFPVADLVIGAPKDEKIDIAFVFWLIRGNGHNILFDCGFHRERWFKEFPVTNYLRPDKALKAAGVESEQITDIVVSHAHWDHLDGIDLFPKAVVWIQEEEFRHYTGAAWQPGGDHGGIDPDDVQYLVRLNTEGRLRLVKGDNVEIMPGIRVFTGGHHTYASEYLLVEGEPRFVLASDNMYLYRNLQMHAASATFTDDDHAANIRNQARMVELAGSPDRVIPGHDALQFQKFPTQGRVTTLKSGK